MKTYKVCLYFDVNEGEVEREEHAVEEGVLNEIHSWIESLEGWSFHASTMVEITEDHQLMAGIVGDLKHEREKKPDAN